MGTEAELRAHGAALYGLLSAAAPHPEARGLEDPIGRLARIARRAMGHGPPFASVRALRAALLVALGDDAVPPEVRAHLDALAPADAAALADDRTIPDDLFALTGLAAAHASAAGVGAAAVRALEEPTGAVSVMMVDDRADTLELPRYIAKGAVTPPDAAMPAAAPDVAAPAAPVAPAMPAPAPAHAAAPSPRRARGVALAVIAVAALVIVACLVELVRR